MIEHAVNAAGADAARKSSLVKKLLEQKIASFVVKRQLAVNNSIDDSETKTKKKKKNLIFLKIVLALGSVLPNE